MRDPGAQDAGDVGEHVEPPVTLDDLVDERGREVTIGHVTDRRRHFVARPPPPSPRVLRSWSRPARVDVDGDDRGALGCESHHRGLADAGSGAGDDRDPSVEALHGRETRTCSRLWRTVGLYGSGLVSDQPPPFSPPPPGAPYPASAYQSYGSPRLRSAPPGQGPLSLKGLVGRADRPVPDRRASPPSSAPSPRSIGPR